MINTGITRKMDTLGRIVIPKELRTQYSLNTQSDFEIWNNNGELILRPVISKCFICNSDEELVNFKETLVCRECITESVYI